MGKLLVVDDEERVREALKALLSSLKYDVIQAKDGLEASLVYQALRGEISLVIMNTAMPRMDGYEATKVIKKVDPSAKIILLSGRSDQIPSAVKPSAFLFKPFTRQDLCEIVQLVMKSVA